MKILATPRDPNPYQRLLYEELERCGWSVRYPRDLTPSRTVNIALLPVVMLAARAAGVRLLHLHWTFHLVPPWAGRFRLARRVFRWWFAATLVLVNAIGLRIVWTAHNVLPHAPVFDDDARARRVLVRRCAGIVALTPAVADEVRSEFGPECAVTTIPHGPFAAVYGPVPSQADARHRLCLPAEGGLVVHAGRVHRYKGVLGLVTALECCPPDLRPAVVIAGECSDDALAADLRRRCLALGRRVQLRLDPLNDDDLVAYLRAATVVALPFERVSTSGSLLFAMGLAAPCVVTACPELADVPDEAVIRVARNDPAALGSALRKALGLPPTDLDGIGQRAQSFVDGRSWASIAQAHADLFASVVDA